MVAAIVSAAISAVGAAATGATLGASLAVAGLSIVGSALNGGFRKPKAPAAFDFQTLEKDRTLVVRSSVEPRRYVYGRANVSGPLVFARTTGDKNEILHMVIPLAAHQIESVDEVYLNDRLVTDDNFGAKSDPTQSTTQREFITVNGGNPGSGIANFEVTINGTLFSTPTLNTGNNLADVINMVNNLYNEIVGDAGYAGENYTVSTQLMRQTEDNELSHIMIEGKNPTDPFEVTSVPQGFGNRLSTDTMYAHQTASNQVVGWTFWPTGKPPQDPPAYTPPPDPGEGDQFYESEFVRINVHLGEDDQLADGNLVSEVAEWTSNHRLRGIAYMYLRIKYDEDRFATGVPNVKAVIKGKNDIFDPRTSTTGYTTNPALCMRDYVSSEYGLNMSSAEIDDTSFIAAANVCDEQVAIDVGGTLQDRYQMNGTFQVDLRPFDIMEDIASAMAGAFYSSQGKYVCLAGAYRTPTVSLDEDDLRGPLEVTSNTPRASLYNAMKGVYANPNDDWQPVDFPPVTNSTYETQDGSERIYKDIELPFTIDPIMAQRIAKLHLEKSRQGITVSFPCKDTAIELRPWDTVNLTIDKYGWTNKVFRVEDVTYQPAGGMDLLLQEESSASYDWAYGDATTVDPAPDTDLNNPFEQPPAPTGLTVEEELYQTNPTSGVKSRAVLTWTAPTGVTVLGYEAGWKLAADPETSWVDTNTALTRQEFNDTQLDTYDFRVRAINSLGIKSDWAYLRTDLQGLLDPPGDVQNFTLIRNGSNADLSWDLSTDLDVLIGGNVKLRYSVDTSATWGSAQDLALVPGNATQTSQNLFAGVYFAKFVDASGVESENAAAIITDTSNVINQNVVANLPQDPDFDGALTNMSYDAGNQEICLDGSGLFEAASGDFDDFPGVFDAAGGFATSGQYVYDVSGVDYFDLGAVYTSKLIQSVVYRVDDPNNLFDLATGQFDSRTGLFDNVDPSDGNVQVQHRLTNDDPTGSPTWSAWAATGLGDYTFRAAQFRAVVTSTDSTKQVCVEELDMQIDMQDRVAAQDGVSIPAIGTTITFSNAFYNVPSVGITINSGSAGDTPVLTNVTTDGFDIQLFDTSNVAVARNVNWVAVGYGFKT